MRYSFGISESFRKANSIENRPYLIKDACATHGYYY